MGMASYLVVSSFFFNLVWMSAQREAQQGKSSESLVGREIVTGYHSKATKKR